MKKPKVERLSAQAILLLVLIIGLIVNVGVLTWRHTYQNSISRPAEQPMHAEEKENQ